jgi:polyisoprenoid-binding protein YceI
LQTRFSRFGALLALTGTVTTAAIGFVLFNPGPAFTQPRLLSASHIMAADAGGSYTIDPVHTSIGFDIQHLGISRVQGRFDTKSGHITVNPSDLSHFSVSFTAQVSSIDTNVAPRDSDLRSPNYFDADKYPTIDFQSTQIRKSGNHYVADGNLTIKDKTQPISLPFRYAGPIQDPFGGTRIGIVADPIIIHRDDFGVGSDAKLPNGAPELGNDVTVLIAAEATLDKPGVAPTP